MILQFNEELLYCFQNAEHQSQGSVGRQPKDWFSAIDTAHEFMQPLPTEKIDRTQVRAACLNNPDVLYGYVLAMAWGGQRIDHGRRAWAKREAIRQILERISTEELPRSARYELFRNPGISGLGPAFFTKLLYFFSPPEAALCPIMDQWTVKSVLLITAQTGGNVVRFSPNENGGIWITHQNTGENYERFCQAVEAIADRCSMPVSATEEKLFSVGKPNPGKWRSIVSSKWRAEHY